MYISCVLYVLIILLLRPEQHYDIRPEDLEEDDPITSQPGSNRTDYQSADRRQAPIPMPADSRAGPIPMPPPEDMFEIKIDKQEIPVMLDAEDKHLIDA